jgi:hypothetical protein
MEVPVNDKPISVLDVIGWCKVLESRLEKIERAAYAIADIGEFERDEEIDIMDGEGDRSITEQITFKEKLDSVPTVFTSLSGLNSVAKHNTGIELIVENVTSTGCDIIMKTWGSSKIPFVKVSWIALVKN